MSQNLLQMEDAPPGFQKMRGKGVPGRMNTARFGNASCLLGLDKSVLTAPRMERPGSISPRKKPPLRPPDPPIILKDFQAVQG